MVFLDFSINNLTLMALTIATGFVVDDAIVVIENISRYIEKGEKPLAAALKGAGEIGFTIISLTFSADRGVDPAAVYGRYRRPPVPRIRRHPCRRYSYLGGGLPDPDADDVRPHVKPRIAAQAEPILAGQRAFLRTGDRRLWPLAEPGAEPSVADALASP